MSDSSDGEVNRGPNGFPYIDIDQSIISAWESGDFQLKVRRDDGEMLRVNLTANQLNAMVEGGRDTLERAAHSSEVDYDG